MKKTLIALAALAVVSAASAQSTVTMYGILDAYVASNSVDTGTGSVSTTHVGSGAVNGSRWGMKGSEDLGGGLKANFKLESGFSIDTGASGQGALFGRQALVGLSGGFGAVSFGHIATPYYDVDGAQDAMFNSALSPEASIFRSSTSNPGVSYLGGFKGVIRSDNTIRYDLPSMNGFGASVSYSLDEKVAAATLPTVVAAGLSVTSVSVTYAGGPAAVSFAYQNEAKYLGTVDQNFTRLQGSYDLGAIVAKAGFGKVGNVANVSGAETTEFMLGADYKASAALTLSASYANSKDNTTQTGAAAEAKRTAFGLGAAYTLSKRTFVYGGYESDTQTQDAKADKTHSLFAVGVQHRF